MGRELKRVALDFDWPRHKIWKGYLNQYNKYCQKCPRCDGTGYNVETKRIYDQWYSFDNTEYVNIEGTDKRYNANAWHSNLDVPDIEVLVKRGRLMDLVQEVRIVGRKDLKTKNYRFNDDENGGKWVGYIDGEEHDVEEPVMPSPLIVNEWDRRGLGHDCINQWICVKAKAERLGVYGKCDCCAGEGDIWSSQEMKEKGENWVRYGPPSGDGFQLWENTSEGSPVSPVFDTLDGLCGWLEDNGTTFANNKVSKEAWLEMLGENFVRHENDAWYFYLMSLG